MVICKLLQNFATEGMNHTVGRLPYMTPAEKGEGVKKCSNIADKQ